MIPGGETSPASIFAQGAMAESSPEDNDTCLKEPDKGGSDETVGRRPPVLQDGLGSSLHPEKSSFDSDGTIYVSINENGSVLVTSSTAFFFR
jgi:hypothetical protein